MVVFYEKRKLKLFPQMSKREMGLGSDWKNHGVLNGGKCSEIKTHYCSPRAEGNW